MDASKFRAVSGTLKPKCGTPGSAGCPPEAMQQVMARRSLLPPTKFFKLRKVKTVFDVLIQMFLLFFYCKYIATFLSFLIIAAISV